MSGLRSFYEGKKETKGQRKIGCSDRVVKLSTSLKTCQKKIKLRFLFLQILYAKQETIGR